MSEDDRGWGKLLDSAVSGALVLWALLAYGFWTTVFTDWRDMNPRIEWNRQDRNG